MTLIDYPYLKELVVLSAGVNERHNQLLDTLKELFKDKINSPRRFENINTIGQLIKILELRDALSEDNVTPLKEITWRLPNNTELLKKINEYEENHVPRKYLNYYTAEDIQNTSNRVQYESLFHTNPYSNSISKIKKQRINETIIEEIGTYWRDLGRNLKIRECFINDIDNNNTTLHSKAVKLLEQYERKADPQRWFFVLCDALEHSRRRDLSRSLQEIMSMNI